MTETKEPDDPARFELAIAKAMLESLKCRNLLTPDQVKACTEKLELNYHKNKR